MRTVVFLAALVVLSATAVAGWLAINGAVEAAIFLLTIVAGPLALLGVIATLGVPRTSSRSDSTNSGSTT